MNIININQNLIVLLKITKLLVDSIFTKFFIKGVVWSDKSSYLINGLQSMQRNAKFLTRIFLEN